MSIDINRSHIMTCLQPATRWEDALPTGNGTVGAMVYGHICEDTILLNHEALFLRTDRPRLPDVSGHLPELRKLLAEGKYAEAEYFLPNKLKEAGYDYTSPDPYHPAFDIEVLQHTPHAFSDYRRTLDMSTGEVIVQWKDSGVTFTRSLVVSRPDEVIALRIAADKPGAVSCRLRLTPHGRRARGGGTGNGKRSQIVFQTSAEAPRMQIVGMYDRGGSFGGAGHVHLRGGKTTTEGDCVVIEKADEALLLVKLYANDYADVAEAKLAAALEQLPADYKTILSRHAEGHREIFHRCRLELPGNARREDANERLLLDASGGDVHPALTERMFDFSRHLLICSSWGGRYPANLQGIWNGEYDPKWSSDFHNNENIQMNYWQALPAALPEVTEPYFDMFERSLDDYRRNARCLFGCRGIVAAHAQTTHGLQLAILFGNWTAGAGWLAQLYYDYWLFTGDEDFLRDRAVPFMREVALFYEDFCIIDPDGQVVFAPSLSPENHPLGVEGHPRVVVNATMDFAVARELLGNLVTACEHLGIEQEGTRRWRELLAKMPDYQVNSDGAIAEWMHPELEDNYHHRHQSHIYPLFPGLEVTAENNPELFEAIETAVEKRLVVGLASQTGWSLAHMANIFARLGDGERALECLDLMTRACTGPNLLTYHNDWRMMGLTLHWHGDTVFQIDAILGFAAAVLEMLVQSRPGFVSLLPALPHEWPAGRIVGVRCRGAVTVSVDWDRLGESIVCELFSQDAQEITLGVPGRIHGIEPSGDEDVTIQPSELGNAYRRVRLPADRKVTLRISM
ncbi:MAG: glycosyl hydrolase family 95 catalytic domain-containing protein [Phycisphaerae bacterium]